MLNNNSKWIFSIYKLICFHNATLIKLNYQWKQSIILPIVLTEEGFISWKLEQVIQKRIRH